MFAAVRYFDSTRKRKYDVLSVSNISKFTNDYDKKKFKITSPEGDILDGQVIFTGCKYIACSSYIICINCSCLCS